MLLYTLFRIQHWSIELSRSIFFSRRHRVITKSCVIRIAPKPFVHDHPAGTSEESRLSNPVMYWFFWCTPLCCTGTSMPMFLLPCRTTAISLECTSGGAHAEHQGCDVAGDTQMRTGVPLEESLSYSRWAATTCHPISIHDSVCMP